MKESLARIKPVSAKELEKEKRMHSMKKGSCPVKGK